MKYTESVTKSANYLRLALPFMTKNNLPVSPVNYTICYEYAAKQNKALRAAVDQILKSGRTLTSEDCDDLHRQFIAHRAVQNVERMQKSMRGLLANILENLLQVDDSATQYSDALAQFSTQLEEDPDGEALQAIISGVIAETESMKDSYSSLKSRLNQTTEEVGNLRTKLQTAREEALVDALTGVTNRKGFMSAVKDATSAASDDENPPCLLMVDIDHFKSVNDTYGHLFGDQVLKLVAATMEKCVKGQDTVSRIGGRNSPYFCRVLLYRALAGLRRAFALPLNGVESSAVTARQSLET